MTVTDRPLRRDAERNRARLLEAARELFAQRGLEVTMDDIAHAAGVGVGTAYRRFRSRDELVAALFEARMQQYVDLAGEALEEPDAWVGLTGFLERSVAMQAADRGLRDLLTGHAHTSNAVLRIRRRILPVVEQLVERAIAAGQLRPDVTTLDMPIISLMLANVVDFATDVSPDLWRRHLALVLDGLRAREGNSPLPVAALQPRQMDRATAAWRPARRP
jgi:AcrR family transcriptional regulator